MRELPTTKLLTLHEVGELSNLFVAAKFTTRQQAATHYGVSGALMTMICNGKRRPPKQMMHDMGLSRVDGYIRDRSPIMFIKPKGKT